MGVEEWGNQAVVSTVAERFMPDRQVSDKQHPTHMIGARAVLECLATGDLRPNDLDKDFDAELVGVYIGRVVENARKQGISVPGVDLTDVKHL